MHVSEAYQAHKSSALQFIKASAKLHLCACLSLPMRLLVQYVCIIVSKKYQLQANLERLSCQMVVGVCRA